MLIILPKHKVLRPKQNQNLNVRPSFPRKKGFPISRKAHKYCVFYNYSMIVATLPEPTVRPPSRSDFAYLET